MGIRVTGRMLRRTPAYAATAIGTIALSISLAAVVFAVVDGVLFKPLPFPASDRLFHVQGSDGRARGTAALSPADVRDLAVGDSVAWWSVPGSYASGVIAPAGSVVRIRDGVSDATAAAAMLQGMTAHYLVHGTRETRSGDVALVHARTTFTTADGRPGASRYTDVWARRNGRWVAVAAQVTRY